MPKRNEAHSALVRELRLNLGNAPDVVLWPNNNGVATFGNGAKVKYGLVKGCADLVGILAPHGRWLALECKTGDAITTPEQALFLNLVRSKGGFACVVRSLEEGFAAIERARQGADE
jgi:hypothetical protein